MFTSLHDYPTARQRLEQVDYDRLHDLVLTCMEELGLGSRFFADGFGYSSRSFVHGALSRKRRRTSRPLLISAVNFLEFVKHTREKMGHEVPPEVHKTLCELRAALPKNGECPQLFDESSN